MVENKVEKEKLKVEEYELVKVPTEYGLSIQTPDERLLSPDNAIVEILNALNRIEKKLGNM